MPELANPLVANSPAETSQLFEKAANAHDVDALMTLYEPKAASASSQTESVSGADAIRQSLTGMIGMRPTFRLMPFNVITAGDLAMVAGDWTMEATDPSGNPMSMKGRYVDVVRRQSDGRWLVAIDNPWMG